MTSTPDIVLFNHWELPFSVEVPLLDLGLGGVFGELLQRWQEFIENILR